MGFDEENCKDLVDKMHAEIKISGQARLKEGAFNHHYSLFGITLHNLP